MKKLKFFLILFIGYLGLVVSLHAEVSVTHQEALLSIPGMNCSTCPIMINKVLAKVDGVINVSVNLERNTATVEFDSTKVKIDTILKATQNVGYPSSILTKVREN